MHVYHSSESEKRLLYNYVIYDLHLYNSVILISLYQDWNQEFILIERRCEKKILWISTYDYKVYELIARIHPFSENMDNYEIHLFASYFQHFLTINYLILNTGWTTVVIFWKLKMRYCSVYAKSNAQSHIFLDQPYDFVVNNISLF